MVGVGPDLASECTPCRQRSLLMPLPLVPCDSGTTPPILCGSMKMRGVLVGVLEPAMEWPPQPPGSIITADQRHSRIRTGRRGMMPRSLAVSLVARDTVRSSHRKTPRENRDSRTGPCLCIRSERQAVRLCRCENAKMHSEAASEPSLN